VTAYINELASTAAAKKALCDSISCSYEEKLVKHLSALVDIIDMRTNELENILIKVKESSNMSELSCAFRDEVLPAMQALRIAADEAESVTAEKFWPYPTYGDLLFSVR
ncbi:MAG TPA: glutamine synthetase type III, partial [Bacillota bacterium]|nr:glutamine synthetase type III [Bacillota bacterium]